MEDSNDLLIDLRDDFIEPSWSFGGMEHLILEDNDGNPKENEEISFGHIESVYKLENLEGCKIVQDGESDKDAENNVQ